MGIHPLGMQWHLPQGAVFSTPECVMVRSKDGLGGMSRSLHRLFVDRLIPHVPGWDEPSVDPPVLLNSWEAKYFNVNHSSLVEMAQLGSKIGINLVVLDDGWFGQRDSDITSLGDWIPDLRKFPAGLKALADDINAGK
jgi:alpha-galactosidase